MKRFIKNNLLRVAGLLAAFILAACVTFAQDYKRVGNKFIQQSTAVSATRDTLATDYTVVIGGNEYQVIINKSTGSCYIWKISKRSGKWYKQYLKKELSMQIAKELGIEYKGSPIGQIKKK